LSHPSVTAQKSGSTSAPADAQSKHLPHACSMLAACLQLVAHTNKSSEHLLLVELQRCHMFPGRRQAGHTGCRSEGCFWARYWYRQSLHRVQCRGPRSLRRGERLIVLHRLHVPEVSSLFHCFVFFTRSVDRDRDPKELTAQVEGPGGPVGERFLWKPGLRPRHPDDIGFSLLPHVLGPGYE
jgi:hypothetical protein